MYSNVKKRKRKKTQSWTKRELSGHGLPRLIVSSVIFLPLLVNSSSISKCIFAIAGLWKIDNTLILRSLVRSGEVHKRKKSLMRQGTSRWTDSLINNSTDAPLLQFYRSKASDLMTCESWIFVSHVLWQEVWYIL